MKILTHIVAALFGLMFIASGLIILLNVAPPPPPFPEGSAAFHFMNAFMPTGYMTMVKAFEVLGGILVIIPRTRRAGLMILGSILVNVLAFHGYVLKGEGLFSPMLMIICVLALFLVWTERRAFALFLGITKPAPAG